MEREMTTVGASAPTTREALAVDAAHANRPGVPMEAEPHADPGASWDAPEQQLSQVRHLKRKGLQSLTPVYGTAQPPKGLSGVMRRAAYEIPEHKPSHWALLMAADRVDVLEHGLTRLTSTSGALPVGREVRSRPLLALAVAGLAGVMLARATR
jgi:hypothetical protein